MRALRLRASAIIAAAATIVLFGIAAGAWAAQPSRAVPDIPQGTLYVANLRTPEVVEFDLPAGNVLNRIALPAGAHELMTGEDGAIYASLYRAAALVRLTPEPAIIPVPPRPHGIAALPGGTLLVTLGEDSALAAFDIDGHEQWRVGVGEQPHAVAVAGSFAYTANGGDGTVSVIDIARRTEVERIKVGAVSESIAIGAQGEVYIANAGSGDVAILDPRTGQVATVAVGGKPVRVVATRDGGALVSAGGPGGGLAAIDAGGLRWRIPLGPAPDGIALDPSQRWAFVAENTSGRVFIIELSRREIRGSVYAGDGPSGVHYYSP